MRLELHPEARAELRSAALWYNERRPGLRDEFIADVSAGLDRIGDAPESYPAWPRTRIAGPLIRKATVQRFPYLIAFEEHEQHVLVLAVASPSNLQERVDHPEAGLSIPLVTRGVRSGPRQYWRAARALRRRCGRCRGYRRMRTRCLHST